METLLDIIPGYREAVQRENALRDEAFLNAPEYICGIEVRPLTLPTFAMLHAIGSPFVCGGGSKAEDVALFLWAVSPDYEQAMRWRDRLEPLSRRMASLVFSRIRHRFVRRLRGLNAGGATRAVDAYVDDALMDAPRGATGSKDYRPAYWSMLAGMVGILALETGWSEADILALPLKRLFQYMRLTGKRNNPDKIMFNPSDAIRSKWLRELNSAQRHD